MGAVDDDVVVVIGSGGTVRIPRRDLVLRTVTSGGPGGQHANRSATRVEVRLDLATCGGLSDEQRARAIERLGPVARTGAADERSQYRNRVIAEERLARLLADALRVDRPRRSTRPGRGAVERRLAAKRRRSETKAARHRPEY